MGFLKKSLAVGTLGGSLAAEKAAKAAAGKIADARSEEGKLEREEKRVAAGEAQAAERERQRAEREAAGIIFEGVSHDSGRNSNITLYNDRIERVKPRSFGSMSKANQDMEVTPIKSVTSVQAKKDGIRTKVTVYASGNTIEFRCAYQEANRFKTAITNLILAKPEAAGPTTAPPPAIDHADQIKKLGELRDQGLLTPEEFEAKKTELLSRM
jgi:hypothetical protein